MLIHAKSPNRSFDTRFCNAYPYTHPQRPSPCFPHSCRHGFLLPRRRRPLPSWPREKRASSGPGINTGIFLPSRASIDVGWRHSCPLTNGRHEPPNIKNYYIDEAVLTDQSYCRPSTEIFGNETCVMNHPACNVKSRSLNCWNSVSTAQLLELTSDVFETSLQKTVQHTLPAGSPGTVQARPEASSDTVGVGEQDEGVSDRGVILIASSHGKNLKNASKKN